MRAGKYDDPSLGIEFETATCIEEIGEELDEPPLLSISILHLTDHAVGELLNELSVGEVRFEAVSLSDV